MVYHPASNFMYIYSCQWLSFHRLWLNEMDVFCLNCLKTVVEYCYRTCIYRSFSIQQFQYIYPPEKILKPPLYFWFIKQVLALNFEPQMWKVNTQNQGCGSKTNLPYLCKGGLCTCLIVYEMTVNQYYHFLCTVFM